MAGSVRHLVQRGDGFWARIVVPKEMRPIIGKTELRTPLGSSRRLAERDVHAGLLRQPHVGDVGEVCFGGLFLKLHRHAPSNERRDRHERCK